MTLPDDRPEQASDDAEALFAAFVEERETGAAPEFEELVAEHPSMESRLRAHYRAWLLVQPILDALVEPTSPGGARLLAGYRVIRPIGGGGSSLVLEAERAVDGLRVALKLLHGRAGHGARELERFRREALAVRSLEHPGIVRLHEVGEVAGVPFLALELIEGGRSLRDLIDEARRLPAPVAHHDRTVAIVLAATARAVDAAHAAGMVHRDLKPSNVLLAPGNVPRVADFGLVKLGAEVSLSRTGDLIGTLHYMSPEQARGGGAHADARSDVFSLGATLYEALTLERPFAGDTPQQVLDAILHDDPPDPRTRRSRVPPTLAWIVARALEKDPRRRYPSAAAFADDLERSLAGRPIQARPLSPLRRVRRWLHRHRGPAAVATAAGLVAAVLALSLAEARAARKESTLRSAQFERLADGRRLEGLEGRALALGPGTPEHAHELRDWLADAERLAARKPHHAADLTALRAAGAKRDEDAWLIERLDELVDALESFTAPVTGTIPRIQARLAFAESVAALTMLGPEPASAWADCMARVADPADRYAGLHMSPQVGLLPLGPDPASGLEEFAHLASGERAVRDASGTLILRGETGVVLVLIPGGRYATGAQATNPGAAHYDPEANALEGPVMELDLDPYFIAKHEFTQAQWLRATGRNPSYHYPGRFENHGVTLLHPVEQVRWIECVTTLASLDLVLPTVPRWESAARGGTVTQWWAGDRCETLTGVANLADGRHLTENAPWAVAQTCGPDFDGFTVHAPIDAMAPNPFGLHFVHGNVAEWAADAFLRGERRFRPGDGAAIAPSKEERVHCGGSYYNNARAARITSLQHEDADFMRTGIGLRAARDLRP